MTTSPESKWTKGPWSAKAAKYPVDGALDWAVVAEIDGQPRVIAESFGRVADSVHPNAEANAHLIAAAPDMAEALKLAETTLTRYIRTPPGEGMHEFSAEEMAQIVDAHPTIIAIRAALSKAEGR